MKDEIVSLHNISRNGRFLSTDTTKALIHAFVTSRVDYCNLT